MTAQAVHPVSLVDGERVVNEATVEACQLTPDGSARFAAWADATVLRLADGGVFVLDSGVPVGQLALGDFLVRLDGRLRVEPADGFWQRYAPADTADGAVAEVPADA